MHNHSFPSVCISMILNFIAHSLPLSSRSPTHLKQISCCKGLCSLLWPLLFFSPSSPQYSPCLKSLRLIHSLVSRHTHIMPSTSLPPQSGVDFFLSLSLSLSLHHSTLCLSLALCASNSIPTMLFLNQHPIASFFKNFFLSFSSVQLSRGLLKFGESKPLGESGLRWLKIHLANVFGKDKYALCDNGERGGEEG